MLCLKGVHTWVALSIFFIGVLSNVPNTVFVNERVMGDLHYYEFSETDRYSKDVHDSKNKEEVDKETFETVPIYQKTTYGSSYYSESSRIDTIFLFLVIFAIIFLLFAFSLCECLIGVSRKISSNALNDFKYEDDQHSEKITHDVTLWKL